MYLQIAINSPLPKTFIYELNNELIDNSIVYRQFPIGYRVLVNFNNRNTIGIVIDYSDTLPVEIIDNNIKIKHIIKILDNFPIFSTQILKLIKWLADYYIAPIGEVCFTALPSLLRKESTTYNPIITHWKRTTLEIPQKHKLSPKALFTLEIIKNRIINTQEFKELGVSTSTLKSLENKGFICECHNFEFDNNTWLSSDIINQQLSLNEEQKNAIETISQYKGFQTFVINGVTGSGKTEVYLQLIAQKLEEGLQILVLVPEINLTPQTVKRFYQRFNVPIACLHSSMNDTEKLNSYLKIKDNKAAILIGTRSALFANFKNLGLIIIDEEHDQSYRQTQGVYYSARDCAVMRGYLENIPVILGSATPSLETLANIYKSKYKEIILNTRAGNAKEVSHFIVDMRKEQKNEIFSTYLLIEIKQTIERNEQVILFLNRRGFAPAQICHDCGFVFKCNNCDVNLCYHKETNSLICHHCERHYHLPYQCPQCNGTNIIPEGFGTEKVTEELKKYFPQANIARIDRDSTSTKGSLENFIENINENKFQILIGTQMLAKGHHFPLVTLVGILNIDSYFYSNDFRSTEKLAQLITQVAGRAGRDNLPGKMILQTHIPNHPVLQTIIDYGYNHYAKNALILRYNASLPPYCSQIAIRADSPKQSDTQQFMNSIFQILVSIKQQNNEFTFTKPYPSIIEKRRHRYHMIIILESFNKTILKNVTKQIQTQITKNKLIPTNLHYVIDVDPVEIL